MSKIDVARCENVLVMGGHMDGRSTGKRVLRLPKARGRLSE